MPRKDKPPVAKEAIHTPKGTIRKGQRKAYRKCTELERESRITRLIEYMGKHPALHESQYRAWAKGEFGLEWNMAAVYIGRARTRIREMSSMSKKEILDVVVPKLVQLTAHAQPRYAVAACRELINIGELKAPPAKRVELSGPDGGPITTKDESPSLRIPTERLRELLGEAAADAAVEEKKK